MKFIRGVMLGTILTAGTMAIWSEEVDTNKKKIVRRGKHFIRRMKMSM